MAAKNHLPKKNKTWDKQELVSKFKIFVRILHCMYGRGYEFLIHAKHKKSYQQQDPSVGSMNVNDVILSLRQGSSHSAEETHYSVITIEQGYCLWRRDIRFKKSADRDIALVHQWQTMLVVLTIGRFQYKYDV
jgi:hypothetical protein